MRYPPHTRDGWGLGVSSAAELVIHTWKSFALIAFALAQAL